MNWKRTLLSLFAVFFAIVYFYAGEYIAGALTILGFTLILTDPERNKLPFSIKAIRIVGAVILFAALFSIGFRV